MTDIINLTREKFANIANAIRSVTGNFDEYTVDEMPNVIEGFGVLQEKIVTKNGEVVPDEGYYGLSKVIVEVPTSSSDSSNVINSYTVNFYDYDESLLETDILKIGNDVSPPLAYGNIVNADRGCWWDKEDGTKINFPFTENVAGTVINLYRHMHEHFRALYSHFGVDMMEFPYITIYSTPQSSISQIRMYFTKDVFIADGSYDVYEGNYYLVGITIEDAGITELTNANLAEVSNLLIEYGKSYEMNNRLTLSFWSGTFYFVTNYFYIGSNVTGGIQERY